MKIALELAETLAAVVDEGTLDAAARRLHITPSAVSQRIKTLERELGRVLLVRSKPARVTDAGAVVVRLARQLTLLEHDARAALGAEEDGQDAPVTVPLAVNADSLATWFLAPLARLAVEHPVCFELHRDDQEYTTGQLEEGLVMGAVTSQAEAVAGCSVTPIGTMRYRAVAAPAFAARWFPDGATAGALAAAPAVDFNRKDELQTDWLVARGVDPSVPPRHQVPSSADFATAVRMGMGWGMLPPFQCDQDLATGALTSLGDPPIDVPLYWQQWNLRSGLLDAVGAAIVAEGRRALADPAG
ncbi:chromosome replication initiation inhibitor protein [Microbacterium mangrovi]|uniref:Chromosome replication initiation inhibitor protein n=1 Tax=Microbacterium mangrovi TaxID=1348253 RepID=A0A0B2A776_9MICO|nr:LysR family transcriptional regulator ArgP [Microbacterium mangrovi]KHK98940.1 chromosome replication initiation inhibitor protein [Microbacterium mangrovi]